jgi:DNA-directed RNA polymerase subunit K/omega
MNKQLSSEDAVNAYGDRFEMVLAASQRARELKNGHMPRVEGKNGYIVDGTEEYADKLYDILYNKNFHMDLDYVRKFNSEEIVMKQYNNFFKKILK